MRLQDSFRQKKIIYILAHTLYITRQHHIPRGDVQSDVVGAQPQLLQHLNKGLGHHRIPSGRQMKTIVQKHVAIPFDGHKTREEVHAGHVELTGKVPARRSVLTRRLDRSLRAQR